MDKYELIKDISSDNFGVARLMCHLKTEQTPTNKPWPPSLPPHSCFQSSIRHEMSMGEPRPAPAALIAAISGTIQALGRGFYVTSDTRLLSYKGPPGSRLTLIENAITREIALSDELVLPAVPIDVDVYRERRNGRRETTPVYSFQPSQLPPDG